MSGWRKRQIHDREVQSMQDQTSDFQEPDGAREGQWPHEALHMLRVSLSTPTGQSMLRGQSVVDVLRGGTGRRVDRSAGSGSGESLAGDRSNKEQTK